MAAKKRPRYRIKLKDLPEEERPRERIILFGPGALSNQELIAAIFGTGSKGETVMDLAQGLLARHRLKGLSQLTTATELKKTFGIDNARACQLLAALELGRRAATCTAEEKRAVKTAGDIAKMFLPRISGLKKEVLKGLCLNSKLCPLKEYTISIGGLNTNSVQPSDVFRTAVSEAAAALVLIHNHPSGDPEPSQLDVAVTKKLKKAGKMLGIEVLDHIVIGDGCYVSLKESGLL